MATAGVDRGLIGPREGARLWERHLVNCAMLIEVLPPAEEGRPVTVADLGSGAGLPGVVLAVARPDLVVTLVEPLERRVAFLHEVVETLGLDGVEVVRGRADALHGQRTFDVVTSRALAPLDRLLEWSMPLVAPTGALVAMKGRSVEEEILAAARTLDRLGCGAPQVVELGTGLGLAESGSTGLSTTRVVRVAHADPSRVAWRPGQGRSSKRRHTG